MQLCLEAKSEVVGDAKSGAAIEDSDESCPKIKKTFSSGNTYFLLAQLLYLPKKMHLQE